MSDEISGGQARELLSGRQAAQLLAEVGLNRTRARQVLAAGLAGEPVKTPSALLYDAARVQALVERPVVTLKDVVTLDLHAILVARGQVDPCLSRLEQVRALSVAWQINPIVRLSLSMRVEKFGPVPFVATVRGFVAFGAELTAFSPRGLDKDDTVSGPGPWFDALRDRRFPTGRGRPWVLHEWGWLTDCAPIALARYRAAARPDTRRAS
jgi:hypothetical protein